VGVQAGLAAGLLDGCRRGVAVDVVYLAGVAVQVLARPDQFVARRDDADGRLPADGHLVDAQCRQQADFAGGQHRAGAERPLAGGHVGAGEHHAVARRQRGADEDGVVSRVATLAARVTRRSAIRGLLIVGRALPARPFGVALRHPVRPLDHHHCVGTRRQDGARRHLDALAVAHLDVGFGAGVDLSGQLEACGVGLVGAEGVGRLHGVAVDAGTVEPRHVQVGVDPLGQHPTAGLPERHRLVVGPEIQRIDGLAGLFGRRQVAELPAVCHGV